MKKYRDHYFKKAKREQFPARSVYKLKEMDKRFALLAPGQRVLDLGAAPGSWTLYAANAVGGKGRVVGVDLQTTETAFPAQVNFLQDDVFAPGPELTALLESLSPFDVVLSDMAPKTTGVKFADQARSEELCRQALTLAETTLRHGGRFVVKIFMGPEADAFRKTMQARFRSVKTFKPQSSRSESKEIFFVGLDFKGQAGSQQQAPDEDAS